MTTSLRDALRQAAADFVGEQAPKPFMSQAELEYMMGTNMAQASSLWERLEFFGLPLVEDEEYYSEAVVSLDIITLDTPPKGE